MIPLATNERQALDTFVRRLYTRFGNRVSSVVLFGSKARGDFGPDSDLDVLVRLTNNDSALRWEIQRLAARVSLEYDLLLSVRAVGRSHWERMARYRSPLFQALQSEGVPLTSQAIGHFVH